MRQFTGKHRSRPLVPPHFVALPCEQHRLTLLTCRRYLSFLGALALAWLAGAGRASLERLPLPADALSASIIAPFKVDMRAGELAFTPLLLWNLRIEKRVMVMHPSLLISACFDSSAHRTH